VGLLLLLSLVFLAALSDQQPENKSTQGEECKKVPVVSSYGSDTETISISVMVRAPDGTPVRGLTGDDFVVKEQGHQYKVSVAQPLLRLHSAKSSTANQTSAIQAAASTSAQERNEQTHLLLLLPPTMDPGTRSSILNSSIKHLHHVADNRWDIAVVDPSRAYTSRTRDIPLVIEMLKRLKTQRDIPQYGSAWMTVARNAIRELSALPGRRLILLACDTEPGEPDRNPWLLRVSPSTFEIDSRVAMAQIYTVQASGPGVIIPGGGPVNLANPGPDIARQISSQSSYLAQRRGELMRVANQTGGRAELAIDDALKDAAKDAAGYYELHFQPDPSMLDGGYHPITVAVQSEHLRVFASPWYLAPATASNAALAAMPKLLLDALTSEQQQTQIAVTPRAWYFPNRVSGIAAVPVAAEVIARTGQPQAPVQIAATIIDERQGKMIGISTETLNWVEEKSAGHDGKTLARVHWSNTVNLPPGSYELRVAALDPSSTLVGAGSWRFLIHPRDPEDGLSVSSLLLASDCQSATSPTTERRNLFNPLTWKDCRLVPAVPSVFHEHDTLRALVRLYSVGVSDREFPGTWSATMSILEPAKGINLTFPVPIERATGPGWAAFAEFSFQQLGLGSGDYQINVAFHGPKPKQTFSLQARFQIVPQ